MIDWISYIPFIDLFTDIAIWIPLGFAIGYIVSYIAD
mgnify:CR=1 FL=1